MKKRSILYVLSIVRTELGTFKWDILNPDRLFNLEINNRGEQALFYLKIKEKRRSSIDLDIHHSKVFSSVQIILEIFSRYFI